MGFDQPIAPPAPVILTRDVFYWPCISGEGLPPSLALGMNYSSYLGKTEIAGSGIGAHSDWPKIPRVSQTGKSILTISASVRLSAGGNGSFYVDENNFFTAELRLTNTVNISKSVIGAAPGTTQDPLASIAAPDLTKWVDIAIVLSDASTKFYVAGVLAWTSAIVYPSSAISPYDGTTQMPGVRIWARNGSAQAMGVANVQAVYS